MFRQGLDTKVLEENGLESYVLSYNGNTPILELWILQYLLKHNVQIKNLYIDLYAYSLSTDSILSDSKILMETDIKGKYELYKLVSPNGNISDFYSIFVSKNMEQLLTWPIYYPIINSTYYKGGTKLGKDGISEEKLASLELFEETPVLDENVKTIQEIIQFCQKNNISLYYIETPKTNRILETAYYQNLMELYKTILEENHVPYYLASDVNSDIQNHAYYFFDLIHLSNQGRKEYSKNLAETIKMSQEF